MPTSSQSKILSVVDYQLQQQQPQQQGSGQGETARTTGRVAVSQTPTLESKRNQSKYNEDRSPSPTTLVTRMQSAGPRSARAPKTNEQLHMPIVDLNSSGPYELSTGQTSSRRNQNMLNNNDDNIDNEYRRNQMKYYSSTSNPNENLHNNSSFSGGDEEDDNDDDGGMANDKHTTMLNAYARRLLLLGTIRPSKSFYKDLPEEDVQYLMEYFRRMKTTNRKVTSEEINQELEKKFVEYKPKLFFDSSTVTKSQVTSIEKLVEQYADQIRSQKAEIVKLENPMRFVIKPVNSDKPLATIPREYNDCFVTLVSRTDPLRKSNLIAELVQDKLVQDIKANSLDISYFPGGVNYDVPHDEIDETGRMSLETYDKLKKRLNNRKIWYFSEPPEKKPNALITFIPKDLPIVIDHQRLLDSLYERLPNKSSGKSKETKTQIVSIEFVPLSCILNSYDMLNYFVIDCDTIDTKTQFLEKPLKLSLNKQSATLEFQSYDEIIQKEYDKALKAEKYRELIKNHDEAVKRTPAKK